jgi:hypothetical protein
MNFAEPCSSCPCRKLFAARFRPNDGCVLTGDLDVVSHAGLKRLLACGPNFRDKVQGNAMEDIEVGIDEFISRFNRDDYPNESFGSWRQEVLLRCRNRLGQIHEPKVADNDKLLNIDARKALTMLKRHLAVVLVDKAANNYAFVCKSLYCRVLKAEFNASGAYESLNLEAEAIMASHKQHLDDLGLFGKEQLPYLYWMPKFHKNPVGYRFIAASRNCTTAKLSKLLSGILTLVLRTLRYKDTVSLSHTGIRRYFVVESFEEVTGFLSHWRRAHDPSSRSGVYTGDFSTMYTTIPHSELFAAIEHVTREAFEWAAVNTVKVDVESTCVEMVATTCTWVRGSGSKHGEKIHTLTLRDLNDLVRFLVSNTFLCNGDSVYRQTVGIPMGTNCAPVLANLFLYFYESAYISRLVANGNLSDARKFHMTFRLIDDVLSVDNPLIQSAVAKPSEEGGMYPAALKLNKTSESNVRADFVGVHIEVGESRFHLSVFDKRKSFPFHVKRYPLMSSLIPKTIPYGVLLGQLHRGYRICTGVDDFMSFASEVSTVLLDNGCRSTKLERTFGSFAKQHMTKYSLRSNCAIKQFRQTLGSSQCR